MMDENKAPSKEGEAPVEYNRRDALKAMAKYSAVVGGAAAVVVSADGLVNEASAYGTKPPKKKKHKKRRRKLKKIRKILRRKGRHW